MFMLKIVMPSKNIIVIVIISNNKLTLLSNLYVYFIYESITIFLFERFENAATEQLFMEQRRVLFCGFNDLLSAQIKYNGRTLKRVVPALLTDISKTNFFIKAD